MATTKPQGKLRWTKVSAGVYHVTSPWGLYTIDGNNYGRNRWTVTYPDGDYGMVDALAEAKAWAEQDAEARSAKGASHATKRAHARSLFPSARDRAEQYLAEGGFQKLYSGLTKRKEPFEIYGTDNGSYSIHLSDDLKEIGTAHLASKWSDEGVHQGQQDYISIVRIDPAYKRQGIATALYKAIERHTGRPLRPSPTDQSDEAKAFWAARARRA